MIFNKTLGVIIILCCVLFVVGLIPIAYIKETISPWSFYLLFLIPLILYFVVFRLNKINDTKGKHFAYIGIFSFIGAPLLPLLLMFIFWDSSFSLEGTFSLVILGILPAVGILLSIYVANRLITYKNSI